MAAARVLDDSSPAMDSPARDIAPSKGPTASTNQAAAGVVQRNLLGDQPQKSGDELAQLPAYARKAVAELAAQHPTVTTDPKFVDAMNLFASRLEDQAKNLVNDFGFSSGSQDVYFAVVLAQRHLMGAASDFFAKFASTQWHELGSTSRDTQIGAWLAEGRHIVANIPSAAHDLRSSRNGSPF